MIFSFSEKKENKNIVLKTLNLYTAVSLIAFKYILNIKGIG